MDIKYIVFPFFLLAWLSALSVNAQSNEEYPGIKNHIAWSMESKYGLTSSSDFETLDLLSQINGDMAVTEIPRDLTGLEVDYSTEFGVAKLVWPRDYVRALFVRHGAMLWTYLSEDSSDGQLYESDYIVSRYINGKLVENIRIGFPMNMLTEDQSWFTVQNNLLHDDIDWVRAPGVTSFYDYISPEDRNKSISYQVSIVSWLSDNTAVCSTQYLVGQLCIPDPNYNLSELNSIVPDYSSSLVTPEFVGSLLPSISLLLH